MDNFQKPSFPSNHLGAPLRLEPRFSKRLATVIVLLHSGALLILWSVALPLWVKLIITLMLSLSAVHTIRKHVLLLNHPLRRCTLHYDTVFLENDELARIASYSFHHPQLVILRLKAERTIYTLILFSDALDVSTFRKLRIRLRHVYNDSFASF